MVNIQYQPPSGRAGWRTYVDPTRNTHVFANRDEAERIARRLIARGRAEYARVTLGNATLAEFGERYD